MQAPNKTPDSKPKRSLKNGDGQRKKTGRPPGATKLKISDEICKQIEGLARIQCTMREAGAVLGVNELTFSRFLRAHEKALEAWENGKSRGKASLRRNQHKMSETNPTMAIWLGKQWLGQKDNMLLGGDPDSPMRVVHDMLGTIDGSSRGLPEEAEQ